MSVAADHSGRDELVVQKACQDRRGRRGQDPLDVRLRIVPRLQQVGDPP